jgi:hypothetical protein
LKLFCARKLGETEVLLSVRALACPARISLKAKH